MSVGTSACTAVVSIAEDLAAARADAVAPTSTPRSASSTSLIRPSPLAIHPRVDEARSVRPTRTLRPASRACLLGHPHRPDLGIGEGHVRQRPVVGGRAVLAEDVAHADRRLVHRHVRERTLARPRRRWPTAPRPRASARRPRASARPGPGRRSRARGRARLGRRPAATSTFSASTSWSPRAMRKRPSAYDTELIVTPVSTWMPSRANTSDDQPAALRLLGSEDPVADLQHRDPYAEARQPLGQLGTDRPAADDDQRAGDGLDPQDVAVGPVRRVREPFDRRCDRRRAGVEHDATLRLVLLAVHLDRARSDEPAVPAHERRPRLLEPVHGDLVVPVVGGLVADPVRDLAPVGAYVGLPGEPGIRRPSASTSAARMIILLGMQP